MRGDGSHPGERALFWFFAWNNSEGLREQEGWPEEGWVFNNYQMRFHSGETWYYYVNGGFAGEHGGLPNGDTLLQVGAEVATPWESVNDFNEQTSYVPKSGGANKPWAANHAEVSEGCIADNVCHWLEFTREPPTYHKGNISGWLPEWGKNS